METTQLKTLMNPSEHPVRQIDRIVSEISGILHAIGEPVPQPLADQDQETQRRLAETRERQLAERERFLKRYQPAIMAFIHTILQDSEAAGTVWDGFVSKWLSGKLGRFDPKKGSFRKYLKMILRNDCHQYWGQQARGKHEVSLASEYDQQDQLQSDAGEAFDRELKESILRRAITAVGDEDERYYHIVKYMTEVTGRDGVKPSTEALRRYLSLQTGQDESLANVRQLKKRAKECLSEKLIEQTGLVIDSCLLAEIEDALSDLDLLRFCQNKIAELRN